MKFSKLSASFLAASAAIVLAACSSGDDSASSSAAPAGGEGSPSAASPQDVTAPALPAAADLNAVLALATDPNATIEQKTATVQGGESAPELFDVMAKAKADSGAEFSVVDPILPGYTPDSVLASVTMVIPGQPEQHAEDVEFVYENGTWKLSQFWTCYLIQNTVTPDQVPAMCASQTTAAANASAQPQAATN